MQMASADRILVEEINEKLQEIINLATIDFSRVGAMLRARSDRPAANGANRLEWASSIITDLQYIDVLKQKVEHMMHFHREIVAAPSANQSSWCGDGKDFRKTCGLIFKLNFYQLEIAQGDFVKSVERIQSKLLELRSQPVDGAGLYSKEEKIFTNFSRVSENADAVANLLARLSELFPVSSDARTLGIVHHLLKHYSMESEREVLRWYLCRVEGNNPGNLVVDDLREEQIHLF